MQVLAHVLMALSAAVWIALILQPRFIQGPIWSAIQAVLGWALATASLAAIGFFLFGLTGAVMTCSGRNWCSEGPAGDIWMLPFLMAFPAVFGVLYLLALAFGRGRS